MRLSAEKGRLDRSLNTAEQELQETQQQILMLQVGSRHSSNLHRLGHHDLVTTPCKLEPKKRHC